MTKSLFLTACIALLFVVAAPAETAAPTPDTAAVETESATTCAPVPTEAAWMLPDIGAQSSCTADCWDGTSRTCDAGSMCSAEDSGCSTNGYCWDNVGGYSYCPDWPTSCEDLHGKKCVTSTTECFAGCGVGNCFCIGGTWECP